MSVPAAEETPVEEGCQSGKKSRAVSLLGTEPMEGECHVDSDTPGSFGPDD
jgi:hypothetical protein